MANPFVTRLCLTEIRRGLSGEPCLENNFGRRSAPESTPLSWNRHQLLPRSTGGLFAVAADPFDRTGRNSKRIKPDQPHGRATGSDRDMSFVCGDCGKSSVLKNNRAVVLPYRRLRRRFRAGRAEDSRGKADCGNLGRSCADHPEFYRRAGKTAQGAQRGRCTSCPTTHSVGISIRRQKRSHANNDILGMITNGLPISKISDFTRHAPRDIYAKINFIQGAMRRGSR